MRDQEQGCWMSVESNWETAMEPGDLVEICREHAIYIYKHWAMYIGAGLAIHVTCFSAEDFSIPSETHGWKEQVGTGTKVEQRTFFDDLEIKPSSLDLGSAPADRQKYFVRVDPVTQIVGENYFRINNKAHSVWISREKCTRRTMYDIFRWIQVHQDKRVSYGVFTVNCEHFVTWLKYQTAVEVDMKHNWPMDFVFGRTCGVSSQVIQKVQKTIYAGVTVACTTVVNPIAGGVMCVCFLLRMVTKNPFFEDQAILRCNNSGAFMTGWTSVVFHTTKSLEKWKK